MKKLSMALVAVCMAFLLSACSETLQVVEDGSGCFSYKHGSWVSNKCLSTKEQAQAEGEEWLIWWNNKQNHEKKDWEVVGK